MKNILTLTLLLGSLVFFCIACQSTTTSTITRKVVTETITDTRDNQTYGIIKIGSRVWMAENLRYEVEEAWDNPKNPRTEYGRLYNWETAKNACPKGWSLPSDADWKELEIALGMSKVDADTRGWRGTQGEILKSKTGWGDRNNGNNRSGFNVLPAGDCSPSGRFLGLGESTSFWTATLDGSTSAWNRHFEVGKDAVNRYTNNVKIGLSCRCIKD